MVMASGVVIVTRKRALYEAMSKKGAEKAIRIQVMRMVAWLGATIGREKVVKVFCGVSRGPLRKTRWQREVLW